MKSRCYRMGMVRSLHLNVKHIIIPVVLAVLMAMPSVVFSWSSDTSVNTPIVVAADDQKSATMVEDGAGGAIIAWTDYRNLNDRDIYAQRVDATGAVLWTQNGVPVCTATDTQYEINIVGDGTGGAIITWRDRRSGSYQIFAQRLDANGNVQWALDGILTEANSSSAITSDGAGGAIMAWTDTADDVYAQRINVDGDVQWTSGNLNAAAAGASLITSDGNGGAIVAWSTGAGDAYAQRVDASGAIQWTAGGVPVVADPNVIESVGDIIADESGGAFIFIFIQGRGYCIQKIDANGATQWQEAVWLTNGDSNNMSYPFIVDGLGGALISWWTYRPDISDPNRVDPENDRAIYVQGVDADGNVRWPTDGLLVGHRAYGSVGDTVPLVSDNAGGFIATWHMADSSYNQSIYAQHFNAAGLSQWGASPAPVCTNSAYQQNPAAAGDGAGGAIFVWNDDRNVDGYFDLYAHRISADGGSSGLQAPSNVSPAAGARIDAPPTLGASAFVDDAGQLSHAASQWRVHDINSVTPETPVHDISGDDGYFTYQLPFSFPFFERTITSISVNTNGLVELLEDGEANYANDRYGTHGDGEHVNNMDAVFAANDDLDLINGYLRLYNAGTRAVIEWYGATYADADADPNYPDVANKMLFQVVLHQDGRITWNFSQLGFTLFDYDLFTGVYANGGGEYSVVEGTLADVSAPAAFEFNPATRAIGPATYAWFEPQPVMYDSGETTDLVSHAVPDSVGLADGATYYWGVRYMGDNDEWSLWSTPTGFVADTLPPTITLREPDDQETGVAGNTVIRATFSEAMAAASIDGYSFTLSGPAGGVAGTVSYAAMAASFTPAGDLDPDTTYTATITSDVTDTVGKQMEAPSTWSFTTGAQADTTPPSVVITIPAVGASDVAIDIGSISVTFNEPMNAATIDQDSFTLTGPDGDVAGAWSYDADTTTARIDPDALLSFATTYTVTITTDIQDNAGNGLATGYSWTFTTVDEPPPPPLADRVPPRVVSATPTALAPASIAAVTVTFSEPIQNIDTTSFRVSDSGGAVPGTVAYDAAAMTAWFYPTADLAFNTRYTVRISSALIRDLADNTMEQDYVGFFTTLGDPADQGCNPDAEQQAGCLSFDDFTFGTGALVGLQGPPHSGFTAEYAARQSVSQEDPDSEVLETTTARMHATAQVDATRFRLRAISRSLQDNAGIIGTAANGASKIEVHGAPPGTVIPMRLVIYKNFLNNGGKLLLRVTDFDQFRTLATMESHVVDPGVLYLQMVDPLRSNTVDNYLRTEHVTLTDGFRFDFLYPAIPNNGIHVNLAVHGASMTAGNAIDVSATLEVDPPPGVTVTLASGQVFSGAADTDGDGVADLEENGSLNNAAVATPAAAAGTGNIAVDVSANAGVTLSQVKVLDDDDLSLLQDGKPTDQNFPDGVVSFRLNGLAPGGTARVTLTFPTAFPPGASYYKIDDSGYYEFLDADFDYNDNTVTLTLTDGGSGDRDGLANGVIDDPGGVAVPNAVGGNGGGNSGCFITTISH